MKEVINAWETVENMSHTLHAVSTAFCFGGRKYYELRVESEDKCR